MREPDTLSHGTGGLFATSVKITIRRHKNISLLSSPAIYLSRLVVFIVVFFSFEITKAQQYDSIAVYMQRYEYQKAINKINSIDKYDSDLKLLELKASALYGLNRYSEAIRVYEKLLEHDSSDLRNIIETAHCFYSLGDYRNAQTWLRKAIRISPRSSYLYQQLGDACYQDDDFNSAVLNYFTAYSADSSFYLSRQLGKCFDKLKQSDTAIWYYQKAYDLNPGDFQTTYRLANLYLEKKDYKTAVNLTDSFLVVDSARLKMLRLNGYLNFLNEDYAHAIESFNKCVHRKDTSYFTNKYLGYSYFREEEYEKAKDHLEQAFQKDTTNAELCYVLGLSCDYSVYKKSGIEYLTKTIELATPSSGFLSHVYQDLAAANTGYYKYDDALAAYLKAYELTPNDTLLIFKIASHYDNWIKDPENALKYYRIFLATRPEKTRQTYKIPASGGMVVSYYDFAERRIEEIKEEKFWNGKKPETSPEK